MKLQRILCGSRRGGDITGLKRWRHVDCMANSVMHHALATPALVLLLTAAAAAETAPGRDVLVTRRQEAVRKIQQGKWFVLGGALLLTAGGVATWYTSDYCDRIAVPNEPDANDGCIIVEVFGTILLGGSLGGLGIGATHLGVVTWLQGTSELKAADDSIGIAVTPRPGGGVVSVWLHF